MGRRDRVGRWGRGAKREGRRERGGLGRGERERKWGGRKREYEKERKERIECWKRKRACLKRRKLIMNNGDMIIGGCVEKSRILTWPLLVLPEAGDAHIQVILLHPGHLPHQPLHRQLTN